MFLVNKFGKIVGGLVSLTIGLCWLYMSYYFERAGAGLPTAYGVRALAGIAILSGLFGLLRAFTAQPPRPKDYGSSELGTASGPAGEMAATSDFDADAALARYMARKAEVEDQPEPEAQYQPAMPAAPEPDVVTRPQFGRKGL